MAARSIDVANCQRALARADREALQLIMALLGAELGAIQGLEVDGRGRADELVITSYSIHYTKLYEGMTTSGRNAEDVLDIV